MYLQTQVLKPIYSASILCLSWISFTGLVMSQAAEDSPVVSIFRECSSMRLDLTPALSSGSVRYKLPSNTLNFLAQPRDVRVRLLTDFETNYRNDVFGRLLVSILREISLKPLNIVESDEKGESNVRYFFTSAVSEK